MGHGADEGFPFRSLYNPNPLARPSVGLHQFISKLVPGRIPPFQPMGSAVMCGFVGEEGLVHDFIVHQRGMAQRSFQPMSSAAMCTFVGGKGLVCDFIVHQWSVAQRSRCRWLERPRLHCPG